MTRNDEQSVRRAVLRTHKHSLRKSNKRVRIETTHKKADCMLVQHKKKNVRALFLQQIFEQDETDAHIEMKLNVMLFP